MKKISRQLTVVRRKIEDFEIQFEDSCGYRPSQAEKQNNKSVRKLLLQQNRLKRQIRLFRESGDSGVWEDYNNQSPYSTSISPINSPNRYRNFQFHEKKIFKKKLRKNISLTLFPS